MNYKLISLETWNRRNVYEWFSKFPNPCYGIDAKIDVTDIVKFSKMNKSSFFTNFIFAVTKAINNSEEMKIRIVDNEIRIYDEIDPTYTVLKEDDTFENGKSKYFSDYKKFYDGVQKELERIKNSRVILHAYNKDTYDVIYATCMPFLDYTSMTHPIPTNNIESLSVPRICWSKYYLENERYLLNFNVTVSHALIDGYHLAKFINLLRDYSLNFKKII